MLSNIRKLEIYLTDKRRYKNNSYDICYTDEKGFSSNTPKTIIRLIWKKGTSMNLFVVVAFLKQIVLSQKQVAVYVQVENILLSLTKKPLDVASKI